MKIVSVVFDYDSLHRYDRLARVLEHSIKKNCPSAEFELVRIPAPSIKSNKKCYESNTVKLDHWLRVLKETDDDVVFMDCDMLVLNDISSAFDDPHFDVGITIRNGRMHKSMPMNGGVVFVRNNAKAIEFIEQWALANRIMYEDILETNGRKLHAKWRSRYAGMNQAAYGYLVNELKYKARIKEFNCSEWNSCIEHWAIICPNTKIVHVKGQLRTAVLSSIPTNCIPLQYRKAVAIWRQYAEEIGVLSPDNNTVIGVDNKPSRFAVGFPQRVKKQFKVRSRYLRREV